MTMPLTERKNEKQTPAKNAQKNCKQNRARNDNEVARKNRRKSLEHA